MRTYKPHPIDPHINEVISVTEDATSLIDELESILSRMGWRNRAYRLHGELKWEIEGYRRLAYERKGILSEPLKLDCNMPRPKRWQCGWWIKETKFYGFL